MANVFNLTAAENAQLGVILNGIASGATNPATGRPYVYADGYAYLNGLLKSNLATYVLTDPVGYYKLDFFFSEAEGINRNQPTPGNLFIRNVTIRGLMYGGMPADEAAFRTGVNSDLIAHELLNDIHTNQGFPDLSGILGSDAVQSVISGQQTIGGWAGAFYYWSTPVKFPGESDWYTSADNRLAQVTSGDGHTASAAGIEQLVAAMASFAPPAAGQTTLSPELAASLSAALAANWQQT